MLSSLVLRSLPRAGVGPSNIRRYPRDCFPSSDEKSGVMVLRRTKKRIRMASPRLSCLSRRLFNTARSTCQVPPPHHITKTPGVRQRKLGNLCHDHHSGMKPNCKEGHATFLTEAREPVAKACTWHTTTDRIECILTLNLPRTRTELSLRCAFNRPLRRSTATRRL